MAGYQRQVESAGFLHTKVPIDNITQVLMSITSQLPKLIKKMWLITILMQVLNWI
jgi:hypothetical protein